MIEKLQHIESAWKGLEDFAYKLVEQSNPEVIVELGVDYGFSLFAFALPNKGKVYGIDWFKGDEHAGYRDTQPLVEAEIKKLGLTNVVLIRSDFTEAAEKWNKKINILHIDGTHHYVTVKKNYRDWIKHTADDAVILMHDTMSFKDDVGKFFTEIELPKVNIQHSHGLGIVCKSQERLNEVINLL